MRHFVRCCPSLPDGNDDPRASRAGHNGSTAKGMSEHAARVLWTRGNAVLTDNRHSRGHRWIFDGGIEVPASSPPHSECFIASSVKTDVRCEPVGQQPLPFAYPRSTEQ